MAQNEPFDYKIIHYKKDGTPFWHNLTCHPMKDEYNTVQYLLIYCEDVTSNSLERMLSRLELEVYEHLDNEIKDIHTYQLITEKIEKHYLHDLKCIIQLYQPNQKLKIVGHSGLPYQIANCLISNHKKIYSNVSNDEITIQPVLPIEPAALHDGSFQFTCSWIKPIYSQANKLKGFISFYFTKDEMITQNDKDFMNRIASLILLAKNYYDKNNELKNLAYYDTALQIPNAHLLKLKLNKWLEKGKEGILILIQPSEYSNIVDLYGRSAGEKLLRQLVDRLNQYKNNQEEFIASFSNSIVIASCIDSKNIHTYDFRIRPLTIIPYFIKDKEHYITLKIGVGYFNEQSTVDDSIRQADVALSKAKKNSGTNITFFEKTIDEKLKIEMDTINELINGINNKEFTIHLQPKINICTGLIEGFEALSRWHSPTLGNVPPNVFIPLAEQSGHIKEIDLIVLTKTLTWLKERMENGQKIVPVAVNISPDHFYGDSFIDDLKAIVQKYNVPLNYLKLELTESIELVDFNKAKIILEQLKEMGIDCSIDDFGVGFSSLSYLPKLPFSEIKIDRSFVNAINDFGMYAVIQTIIQLASNLQMKAVAEGIETMEQLVMLKKMGCHIGQGFYLHKPMTLEVAGALLDSIDY